MKKEKYEFYNTILIEGVFDEKAAILLQNAFPTLEKYIAHPYVINERPLKVIDILKDEISGNFKYLMVFKNKGTNLFFY